MGMSRVPPGLWRELTRILARAAVMKLITARAAMERWRRDVRARQGFG